MPGLDIIETKISSFLARLGFVSQLIAVLLLFVLPYIMIGPSHAGAAQLTGRSLQISNAQPGGTATYTYTFTPTAGAIQSIKFVACTLATGTYGLASTASTTGCVSPTSININQAGSQTYGGTWTNSTPNFTRTVATTGFCTPAANVLCLTRTQATSESAASKSLTWSVQTNPSTTGSFFVGIYLYSDAAYATPTDSGTVAAATTQVLTVSATIQEVLNFCIGTTSVDNATSSVGANCAAIGGTTVGLGTLSSAQTNFSPVTTANGGTNTNGVAFVQTNAVNGITISYDAIQQAGTNHKGTLRVAGGGVTCDATIPSTDATDQCINAKSTRGTIVVGTEAFGMAVAYVNCGAVTGYTCNYATPQTNLTRATNYNCTGTNTAAVTDKDTISTTSQCQYMWIEDGTVTQIASASTIVNYEALILKFGATPAITTPTGAYTAQSDYIAVATY